MVTHIKIVSVEDKPMTFYNGQPGEDAANVQIGIIEKGTVGGQTTLAICLETQDGRNILAEITGNQFEGLIGAFRGAHQRFNS